MTSGPDPLRVIYGDPFTPWLCQTRRVVAGVRTPLALGMDTYCRSVAHDLLIAHVPSGGCSPPTIVARPLCSVPWQDDFPRGNVPTGKGALRSIHWKLDDRPISMKLYEFAAIDGPEETSAAEM